MVFGLSCRVTITSLVWYWTKKIPSLSECGQEASSVHQRASQITFYHLAKIDNRAKELFDRLVKQLAEKEGITEQLKAQDQMAWVGAMNSIRNQAEEIINAEIIYT